MRFLFLSRNGESLGRALQVKREGFPVLLHTSLARARFVGDGLIERSYGPIRTVLAQTKPDVVVADLDNADGLMLESLYVRGIGVVGSSQWTDVLNTDIGYQRAVLKAAQAPVTKTPEQRPSEPVVKISSWFNGMRFLPPVSLTFEYNTLMPQGIGPRTPGQGVAVKVFRKPRLFVETLGKTQRLFQRSSYRGPVEAHLEGLPDAPVIRSIHAGFRCPYTETFLEGSRDHQTFSELLFGIGSGTLQDFKVSKDWLVGIRVSLAPWPLWHANGAPVASQSAVENLQEEALKHLWLSDVRFLDGGFRISGATGSAFIVTARGENVRKGARRALRSIRNLDLAYAQYRTDIGEGAQELMEKLHRAGRLQEVRDQKQEVSYGSTAPSH